MTINEALEAHGASFTDSEIRSLHWRCHQLFSTSSGETKEKVCRLHKKLIGLMLLRGFRHRNTGEVVDSDCVPFDEWKERDVWKLVGAKKPLQEPTKYTDGTFRRLHVRCHTVWSVLSTKMSRPPEELKNVHDLIVHELKKRHIFHPKWDTLDARLGKSKEVSKSGFFKPSSGKVLNLLTLETFLSLLPEELTLSLPTKFSLQDSTLFLPSWFEPGSFLYKALTFNIGRRYVPPEKWDEFESRLIEGETLEGRIFELKVLARRPFITFHHMYKGDRECFVIVPEFLTLVGGLAVHGVSQNDVDIRICDVEIPVFTEAVKEALLDAVGEPYAGVLSFLEESLYQTPFTTYTPLYDIVVEGGEHE